MLLADSNYGYLQPFFNWYEVQMRMFAYSLLIFLLASSFTLKSHSVEKDDKTISIPLKLLENDKSGKTAGINSYEGKLIYMDIWASWCGPCRKSLPILNEIRRKYLSQGFEVVAVNVDEKLSDALTFLDKYPDYPVLLDPKGSLAQAYQLQGMPTAYLIDEKGVIIYKHVGFKIKDQKKQKN